MCNDLIQWVAPAPMWPEAMQATGEASKYLRRPSILRFTSDDFMPELIQLLEIAPGSLTTHRVVPETWRNPAIDPLPPARQAALVRTLARRAAPTATSAVAPVVRQDPVKLYQAGHGRHYLVAANLVCRLPGLPDRRVDPSVAERAAFVLRKLEANVSAGWDEYAFVSDGRQSGWRRVDASSAESAVVIDGEELLPLVPITYGDGTCCRRRLWVGMIPTGKRDSYVGAPEIPANSTPFDAEQLPGRIQQLFYRLVVGPWLSIIDQANATRWTTQADAEADRKDLYKDSRERIQTGSWYVLLDLAEFIDQHLHAVWEVITGTRPRQTLTLEQATFLANLEEIRLSPELIVRLYELPSVYSASSIWRSLPDALAGIRAFEHDLEFVRQAYDRSKPRIAGSEAQGWPDKLFPFADPDPGLSVIGSTASNLELLADQLGKALPADPESGNVPAALAVQRPVSPGDQTRFVIRCVFERPNCAPIHNEVVGEASEPFYLAGFFDPDAPTRPIRIALPINATPGGLRKYDRNAIFTLSRELCEQFAKVRSVSLGDLVRSVLPFPLRQKLPSGGGLPCSDGMCAGLVLSLSLPIITICALILLIVMVALFDLVFRWLPFFLLVLPCQLLKKISPWSAG